MVQKDASPKIDQKNERQPQKMLFNVTSYVEEPVFDVVIESLEEKKYRHPRKEGFWGCV